VANLKAIVKEFNFKTPRFTLKGSRSSIYYFYSKTKKNKNGENNNIKILFKVD
jgi:hypothetical protein